MRSHLARVGLMITVAAVVTTTGAATASPRAASSDPQGTQVNGLPLGTTTDGPLAVDHTGGEHVLAGNSSGYSYYTKLPGDASFSATPTGYPAGVQVGLTPTVSGTAIDLVTSTCNGIKVFQLSDTARKVPPMASAATSIPYKCDGDTHSEGDSASSIVGVSALDDGEVAITLAQLAGTYVGFPGKKFDDLVPPGPKDFALELTCGDPAGDHVYLAEADDQSSQIDLFILGKVDGTWRWTTTAPLKIPAGKRGYLGKLDGQYISPDGIAAIASSHLDVWYVLTPGDGGSESSGTPILLERSPAGVWSKPSLVPGGKGPQPENFSLATWSGASAPEMWLAEGPGDIFHFNRPVVEREYTQGKGWTSSATIPGATGLDALTVDGQGKPIVEYETS